MYKTQYTITDILGKVMLDIMRTYEMTNGNTYIMWNISRITNDNKNIIYILLINISQK